MRSGWSKRWPDKKRVLGTDKHGDVANLHFPGIAPAAATWLVEQRKVKMVGVDTPSMDFGPSKDFRTHRILNGKNVAGLENLAHLEELPARGAVLVAAPMKIRGGSGAPCRVLARVPR
jgi:kynurenine formamidase